MDLSFPNAARSYDDLKQRIRFTGYDGVMEVRCFVSIDVVKTGSFQSAVSERDVLTAFDAMRNKIYDAATRIYKAQRRSSIMLETSDFH